MIERYQTREMRELWSEANRYRVWLEVELAVLEAWAECGEQTGETVPLIAVRDLYAQASAKPLDEAFAQRAAELEEITKHDIIAFTRALSERFGEHARFIHLGLTSTDVVDTAQNLLLVRALGIVMNDVTHLRDFCKVHAVRFKYLPTIGRTHGVHAEPMSFGLKFLNWMSTLERDLERLRLAQAQIGVAMISGSVGTYAHGPPAIEEFVAGRLGLEPDKITNQTVARDRHAEVMSALAILGTTLERIANEIRHLSRTEVREVMEPFGAGQKGSSSMPHKKNPIQCENVVGLARLMRSGLSAALENVALWHERDISHSSVERVLLPDTTTIASFATRRLTKVVEGLVVDEERIRKNLESSGGLVFSQRVLHKLIEHGMSREPAYDLVQHAALTAWQTGQSFRTLLEQEPNMPLSRDELDDAFDLNFYLLSVDTIYARFGL